MFCHMVQVFARAACPDGRGGNLGDSFNDRAARATMGGYWRKGNPVILGRRVSGLKPKDLVGILARRPPAFAKRTGGICRSDVIWYTQPDAGKRQTDQQSAIFFLLSKAEVFYDARRGTVSRKHSS